MYPLWTDCDPILEDSVIEIQQSWSDGEASFSDDGLYEACPALSSEGETVNVTFELEALFLLTSINVGNATQVRFEFSLDGSDFSEYFDERLQSAVSFHCLL